MKFTKKEAHQVAEKSFSRHKSPEHFISECLKNGDMSLADLAEIFVQVYRGFHPKIITMKE